MHEQERSADDGHAFQRYILNNTDNCIYRCCSNRCKALLGTAKMLGDKHLHEGLSG